MKFLKAKPTPQGLTLVEVTLAIGVFTFAMAVLLQLLAPMLTDLSRVLDADETQSIVNKVELHLETFDNDGTFADNTFEDIYNAVSDDGFLEVFVYRTIGGQTQVAEDFSTIDANMSDADPNNDVDGRVFLALIYPSSVNADIYIAGPASLPGDYASISAYSLTVDYDSFPEGFLAFNVDVFAYAPPAPGDSLADNIANNPPDNSGLLLSFSTAINR